MEKQYGKKLMTSSTFSGTFPSPESPSGSENGRGIMHVKGWYSERVPQTGRKGYVAASALMPFSSGRTLPSKWDDAERWISSPNSVVNNNGCNYFIGPGVHKGAGTHLTHNSQRRAKSKSGPLGPHGPGLHGSYSNTFSPVLGLGVISRVNQRNSLTVESSTQVEARREEMDIVSGGDDGEGIRRRSFDGSGDPEWLDLWGGSLSHIDKCDNTNSANNGFESTNNNNNHSNNITFNDDARVDRVISRRDMATQMYPESESSTHSAYSPSPLLNNNEPNMNNQSQELYEVRDVQIDRQISRATQNPSLRENNDNKIFEDFSYSSNVVDEHNKMLKLRGKEARITAWENLQKAKAESAIQKLEMKLEKKRATSTEKIIEKLRRAEIKAQKKRGSLDTISNISDHAQSKSFLKIDSKIPLFCKKFRLSSFTRGCFCHPF